MTMSTEDKNRLIDVLRSSILTAQTAAARLIEAEPDYMQLLMMKKHLDDCVDLGMEQPVRAQVATPEQMAELFKDVTLGPPPGVTRQDLHQQ